MKWREISNKVTSISAGIVAIAALGVTIFEVRTEREFQELSVEPYLQFSSSQSNQLGYTQNVSNTGLGPAVVGRYELYFDDELLSDWGQLVQRLVGQDAESVEVLHGDFVPGMRLPSEETYQLLTIPPEGNVAEMFSRAIRTTDLVEMNVCYCSVYGTCWETNTDGALHQPVRSCD